MKQSSGQAYHLHGIRVLLFGVLLAALFVVRIDSPLLSASSAPGSVLAYATDLNRNDLLNATNAYRVQNGLQPLSLNESLNTASQNKAQHMIDNNYWVHVAPDGTPPWYFFDQAGYNYKTAGENLAYGFSSSASVVDAWINSPSHRDNILGNYVDVGFGYASGASYQNGENTVVVAHYGTPQGTQAPAAPVAPAPTPPKPPTLASPAPTQVAEPSTPTAPAPTATPDVVTPLENPVVEDSPTPTTEQSADSNPQPIAAGATRGITLFDRLRLANPPMLAIVSIAMTATATVGFALTHRSLMRHAVATGGRFVFTHPAFDTAIIIAISILILTTTVGRIG